MRYPLFHNEKIFQNKIEKIHLELQYEFPSVKNSLLPQGKSYATTTDMTTAQFVYSKATKHQVKPFTKWLILLLAIIITKRHPDLSFTLEIKIAKHKNYLDLTISRIKNKHSFKIFRKPTTTDEVMHVSSNHTLSHKYAAFYSMIISYPPSLQLTKIIQLN